ncbi:hypothetical protein [Pyrococcus kukulkanii]|uniref:Uncharacterized protein n=1 Tax=Pyrococcus kukulkanii TaxID=1609559 RepID=A0ABV4T5L0_9EURY
MKLEKLHEHLVELFPTKAENINKFFEDIVKEITLKLLNNFKLSRAKREIDEHIAGRYSGDELWLARCIVTEMFLDIYSRKISRLGLDTFPEDLLLYVMTTPYYESKKGQPKIDEEAFTRAYGMTPVEFSEILSNVSKLFSELKDPKALFDHVRGLGPKEKFVTYAYVAASVAVIKNSTALSQIENLFRISRDELYDMLDDIIQANTIEELRGKLLEYSKDERKYYATLSLSAFVLVDKVRGRDPIDKGVRIIEMVLGRSLTEERQEVAEILTKSRDVSDTSPFTRAVLGAVSVVKFFDNIRTLKDIQQAPL